MGAVQSFRGISEVGGVGVERFAVCFSSSLFRWDSGRMLLLYPFLSKGDNRIISILAL